MSALRLRLRTPAGLLVDRPVRAITAEDRDGWFGIAPGRADIVAALPPGLLVFRDDEGEAFVALAGGLLDLRGDECRVMAREAVMSRALDEVAEQVAAQRARRRARGEARREVMLDLVREAMRRLAQEAKT
ncbi:F0F1 ATP synthase subunit epsilon [Haliangium sp.]|uniref:F0F1 ATP synthase subunit epsilon n=1 Tax=Haliangium sp. TaxID=2663208 RepID=UPI003D0D8EF6